MGINKGGTMNKEMIQKIEIAVDQGFIYKTSDEAYGLTNKGKGKLFENIFNLIDFMHDSGKIPKNKYDEMVLMDSILEALFSAFGSKTHIFLFMLVYPNWMEEFSGAMKLVHPTENQSLDKGQSFWDEGEIQSSDFTDSILDDEFKSPKKATKTSKTPKGNLH